MQAEADMHDEFFGHVLAGLRFGSSSAEFAEAVDLAFKVADSLGEKQVPESFLPIMAFAKTGKRLVLC